MTVMWCVNNPDSREKLLKMHYCRPVLSAEALTDHPEIFVEKSTGLSLGQCGSLLHENFTFHIDHGSW